MISNRPGTAAERRERGNGDIEVDVELVGDGQRQQRVVDVEPTAERAHRRRDRSTGTGAPTRTPRCRGPDRSTPRRRSSRRRRPCASESASSRPWGSPTLTTASGAKRGVNSAAFARKYASGDPWRSRWSWPKLVNATTSKRVPSTRCSASACDDTSITTAVRPSSANAASVRWRSGASGVVRGPCSVPDHAGGETARFEHRRHDLGRGGLAVGARDPDGDHPVGRVAPRDRCRPGRRPAGCRRRRVAGRHRRRRGGGRTSSAAAPAAIESRSVVVTVGRVHRGSRRTRCPRRRSASRGSSRRRARCPSPSHVDGDADCPESGRRSTQRSDRSPVRCACRHRVSPRTRRCRRRAGCRVRGSVSA